MRFTNAFLTALLFCGVTPLAIDKKRDEHTLTIIPSPFATPLSIALVTPSDAAVGGIPDGRHDALEARKPNIKPNTKPNTKPTTKPKTKPKAKPKPKTEPKGNSDAPCTAKQKKAGQCPNQEKKNNWEVLNPTKGCRPNSCKDCGKAKSAKSDRKSGKTTRDSLDNHTLHKRVATTEPASKTKAGLTDWTKDVWASSPRVLPLSPNGFQPTSFFLRWSSLGQGTNFVTVKSLMGCESRKGTR
jgi:outer membrane biosynthesis protein TonB